MSSPYTLAYDEPKRGIVTLMQLIRWLLSLLSMGRISLVLHRFQLSVYQSASLRPASSWKSGEKSLVLVCCTCKVHE